MILWGLGVLIVALFLVFWVRAVFDVYRERPDLSSSAKAAWTIIMLIFPLVGILLYYMIRPSDERLAQG
jgi:hypothetical protein